MLILTTKLFAPRPRRGAVERIRLLTSLKRAADQRLSVISGPPGAGKSTLVCQFASAAERAVAWLGLDRDDNDPRRFLRYLVESLGSQLACNTGSGRESLTSLRQAFDTVVSAPGRLDLKEALEQLVVAPLYAQATPLSAILDDYHLIHSEGIHTALAHLVEDLPEGIHLVIATRREPPLPLARWRARGWLHEVGGAELQFSATEAQSFLETTMRLTLRAEDVLEIARRTEGWAAALQLAGLNLYACTDTSAFIREFSGSDRHVADFLTQELLASQPEHVKRFLLVTSIAPRICDSLAAELLPEVRRPSLEELEASNLLLVALDTRRQWYRYHHLFADLLCQQLKHSELLPDELSAIAARWFLRQGELSEAYDLAAEARNWSLCVSILDEHATGLLARSDVGTLLRWLVRLPETAYDQNVAPNLVAVWCAGLHGGSPDPMKRVRQCEFLLAERESSGESRATLES